MNSTEDDMQAAVQQSGLTAFYQENEEGEAVELFNGPERVTGPLPPSEAMRVLRENAITEEPEYDEPPAIAEVLMVVCAVLIFWAAVIGIARWAA